MRSMCLSLFLVATASSVWAQETVNVAGSNVNYPTTMQAEMDGKKTPMKLTGAAMRKKLFVAVYAVGSYVQADFGGRSAEELASADVIKQLHLVMQRDVSGRDMADAFRDAIRNNYATEFNDEIQKLTALIAAHNTMKGDQVWITHMPGFGLHINLVGKKSEFIKGPKFSKAVWDIYLGPKNVGETVKRGLTSRL